MTSNKYNSLSLKNLIVLFFLKIFSFPWLQPFISFIFTIIISIKILSFVNDINWWIKIIFICFAYLIFEFLVAYANSKKHSICKYSALAQRCIEGQISINAAIANMFYSLFNEIRNNIYNKERFQISALNKIAGFQKIAFSVCQDIVSIISNDFNCKKCQVTIYKQFNDNGNNYVKMIAYNNSDGSIPASYPIKYDLNNMRDKSKPLFVKLFENDSNEPIILTNREDVRKEFKIIDASRFRELKICQYIGVPIRSSDNHISVVLQIDVSEENKLGKNKTKIEQFNCDILSAYCKLLLASYEQEKIHDIMYNYFNSTFLDEGVKCSENA